MKLHLLIALAATTTLAATQLACGGTTEPAVGGTSSAQQCASGGSNCTSKKPNLSPAPRVLAEVSASINIAAMDGEYVYFTDSNASLWRVAKAGDEPLERLASAGDTYAEGLAIDDRFVYWTTLDGVISKLEKTGGTPTVLSTGELRPWGIVVDERNVYWANEGDVVAGGTRGGGAIVTMSKDGTGRRTIAGDEQAPVWLAIDGETIAWQNGPWGDANGAIRAISTSGGAVRTLASRLDANQPISVASGRVYWGTYGGLGEGSITSVSLGGGAVRTVADRVDGPSSIATDGADVFWLTTHEELVRTPQSGGAVSGGVVPDLDVDGIVRATTQVLVDDYRIFVVEYWVTSDGMHSRIHSLLK